ncbi:hypothetical protein ACWOFR_11220 [Carnobacterium gallinarum]|uniref:hypothetical protein n=1 Tax=Carnobacterium gallinarum TaxID=2749 RepID=UPI0005587387|nr:hypothetical protein [Carnobacterium gallinarum]
MNLFLEFAVLLYFMYQQFSFERVSRLNFVAIPIFSLYQLSLTLPEGEKSISLVGILLISLIGLLIGFFQASHVEVKLVEANKSYVRINGEETPIYKKIVESRAGFRYLIGWIFIFGLKYGIGFLLHEKIEGSLIRSLFAEILREIFLFLSLAPRNEATAWIDWLLIGTSGTAFSIYTLRKHELIRKIVMKKEL